MSSSPPAVDPDWNDLLQKRDALHSQIAAVLADLHSLAEIPWSCAANLRILTARSPTLPLTDIDEKLCYVPHDRNEILARLMDAGKFLIARLESKEWQGDWLRVAARVLLRDV
jgi:hypothetical protein